MKESFQTRFAPQHTLLLVVDIQNIQLARMFGKSSAPISKHTFQNGPSKWVEEKGNARTRWQSKFCRVAADYAHGSNRSPCSAPRRNVPAPNAGKCGVDLNSNHCAEPILGSEQDGASHPGSHINKRILVQRSQRSAPAPLHNHGLEDRRRNTVIGRNVPVVPMACPKIPASNKTAGAHSEFQIEWMADEPVFDRQSW